MKTWVNFKELRARLSFEKVLERYGVEVKRKGKQHHGYCPLPNHNGKKNSPSFSANLTKGIFQCFGCGAKGNTLDFAVLMEKLDPGNGDDVRSIALKFQKEFNLAEPKPEKPEKLKSEPELLPQEPTKQVIVNAPLDFELKRLDPNHPYLEKRGFDKETIARFGLGFASKGMLAGRIAIPIHNPQGTLVGYAGRIVDDRAISEEHPRYKFPPPRERDGKVYEFQKLKLLYNAHRIRKPVENLIVVEGFSSVWWLTQMGFPNSVALMGWVSSEEQTRIITDLVSPTGRVWLMSDGDESGKRCGEQFLTRIAPHRFVRWVTLDEGKQPTDYSAQFFREALK